jgi:hypothetical protein
MHVRRIVTGHNSEGASIFASSGWAPNAHDYRYIPGMSVAQLWSTPPLPSITSEIQDPTVTAHSVVPMAGGTQLLFVTFPPDAVMQSPEFDPKAAHEENLKCVPGLAECFEPDHPGMHTTSSIDYGIVLDGEIWLELDGGQLQHLQRHDVVVQNGTRHAWRNKSDRPTLMAFVLIGARRE